MYFPSKEICDKPNRTGNQMWTGATALTEFVRLANGTMKVLTVTLIKITDSEFIVGRSLFVEHGKQESAAFADSVDSFVIEECKANWLRQLVALRTDFCQHAERINTTMEQLDAQMLADADPSKYDAASDLMEALDVAFNDVTRQIVSINDDIRRLNHG